MKHNGRRKSKWNKTKAQIVLRLSYQDKTLDEIGKILGISRERVRQLYKKLTGLDFGKIKEFKKSA